MLIEKMKVTFVRTITEEVEVDLYNYLRKDDRNIEGITQLIEEIKKDPNDFMIGCSENEVSYSKEEEIISLKIK